MKNENKNIEIKTKDFRSVIYIKISILFLGTFTSLFLLWTLEVIKIEGLEIFSKTDEVPVISPPEGPIKEIPKTKNEKPNFVRPNSGVWIALEPEENQETNEEISIRDNNKTIHKNNSLEINNELSPDIEPAKDDLLIKSKKSKTDEDELLSQIEKNEKTPEIQEKKVKEIDMNKKLDENLTAHERENMHVAKINKETSSSVSDFDVIHKQSIKGIALQLASFPKIDSVEIEWKRLLAKYKYLLGQYNYFISETLINGKEKYYRLQIGPFSGIRDANLLCEKLKNLSLDCIVVNNK